MKILLGAILTLALFVIGFCFYKAYQEEHKLARTVRKILVIGSVIVCFNIVSLFTVSEGVCLFAYSVYFMASDWLLYYLLHFSIEYIGSNFDDYVKRKLMIFLLVLDSVSVALNNIFEHLYSLRRLELFGGENYFELDVTPFFYVHYGLVLLIASFCLISLFYRTFTAPVFYRKKYLYIALITFVIVLMNIFSVQAAIDISVIGYVVEAVCIYYCAFMYTPQKLLPKTLFKVAQDMSVALLVLDVDGKKLYKNSYASELLSAEQPLVDRDGYSLEKWCRNEYLNNAEEFTKEWSFFKGEEELILKIQLQRMVDSRSHVQGGYFVIQDRTEEINKLKRERYKATHDNLTILHNRDYFYEKTAKYIRKNPDTELYMICTDIKDFKMINDFMGTKTGDTVLINFAKMLKKQTKTAVAHGRLDNDIFAVMISKEDYKEEYFDFAKKEEFFAGVEIEATLPVVTYVGIYEIVDRTLPTSVMCDRARMAIETIKGDYHKKIAYYNEKMRENALYEQELTNGLSEAIEKEYLKMYLQPQMSSDGKLLGAEALVRWIHPEKGQIMPGDFIPVFERNGLISNVDLYIWEAACKQLQKWKKEGWDDIYISVNISPRDFYFLNIYEIFTELVEKYDIDYKNLKLEITETAIVMDFQRQLNLIKQLRETGFIVEMDDFGSGYSSLNMLKDIHVDILKIDMEFLNKADDEERSKKILKMVIELSKHLGMPVITEGVETAEQVEFLYEMGCNMFQGYYFAKPMGVDEFEKKYLMPSS